MGELQKKEEEMRQMFVQRVKEKEAELKEAEKEVSISCITSVYVSQIYICFVFKTQNNCVCFLSRSCTRNSTVWRNSTRTRKRSWKKRRRVWTMRSTHSNRKRLPQSSCRTKLSRQGAPPHSRGTKRGKSEYCYPALWLYPHRCTIACMTTGSGVWNEFGRVLTSQW